MAPQSIMDAISVPAIELVFLGSWGQAYAAVVIWANNRHIATKVAMRAIVDLAKPITAVYWSADVPLKWQSRRCLSCCARWQSANRSRIFRMAQPLNFQLSPVMKPSVSRVHMQRACQLWGDEFKTPCVVVESKVCGTVAAEGALE
jgi:hypothetical protein